MKIYIKLIILIFQVIYLKNFCELDVVVIACNFQVFGSFLFFSDFFHSNSFIFEPKVEKIYTDVFSTHFMPLISIFAPKIMEDLNNQLKNSDFCRLLMLLVSPILKIQTKRIFLNVDVVQTCFNHERYDSPIFIWISDN